MLFLKHLGIALSCLLLLPISKLKAQEYLEILHNENLTYEEIVRRVEAHFDDKGRGKHTGYKQFLRWKYFARRSLDTQGRVIGAVRSAAAYEAFLKQHVNNQNRMISAWTEKGPMSAVNTATWSSHIGRVTNIAIDPNDDTHMIVTSPGGGVWKTTDEGLSWTPIFDNETTLSVYSALISHANNNHYYVGTNGNGLQRSIDGGSSWSSVSGIGSNVLIYSILMHPTNAQILIACGSNGTIYRSTNGGANWSSNSLQSSALYDLEFKPNNPNIIYTSGRDGGIYKSTNNGVSWSALSGPWSSRSLMMAVTPHDSEYLYVLQEDQGGFGGLYLSTNSGASFSTQSDDSNNNNNIMGYDKTRKGGQAPRDMDVIVSPINKNEVHVAGIMTFKSTNAGVTWHQTTHWVISNPLPFVHADIDQLIYKGSKIYVASDGGVFISFDGGSSFVDRTTGLGLRQFYRISASPIEVGRVAGGSQDNGTGVLRSDGIWYDFVGADGMEPVILNEDEDIIVASIQYGGLYKSIDGGTTRTGINNTQSGENGAWVTPLEKDPYLKNTIYQAKRHVYRSANGGQSWATISNINPSNPNDNKILELCIAPSDHTVIYAAYDEQLFKTVDAGTTWTDITPTIGSISTFNYINVHPANPQHLIIAVSGGSKFLESTNGGTNWTNISYNLPSLGANSVVFDGTANNGIYVSMTKGVYYKDNASPTSWSLIGTGLPNVNITELEIIGNKLYAATYGRGLWETNITALGCALRANVQYEQCNSQGTIDPLDDTFTFSVNPTGSGLSSTYSISGAVTATNLAYGNPYIVDNSGIPFDVAAGPINITLTDDATSTCPATINVQPPESCYTNYICSDALALDGPGTYHADGPSEGNGATHSDATHANWFSFTPIVDGHLTVYSCLMGVDTRVFIYSGLCGSLNQLASSDDDCELSPGGNAYASRIDSVAVTTGTTYLIEWDNRWSSLGFDFIVQFDTDINIDECADYLFGDITNMTVKDELRAKEIVNIYGVGTGLINTYTPGILEIDQSFQLATGAELIANTDTCYVNDTLDWVVLGGAGTTILDNNTVDILLEVPADIPYLVTDIDITIKLNHTYLGDLQIDLISPNNTTIRLWDRYCGGEDNLSFILDEDVASQSLCGSNWRSGGSIFASGFVPVNTLTIFNGSNSVGVWKIRIADVANNDTGNVELLSLRFKGQ